jgi:hypothetical protein
MDGFIDCMDRRAVFTAGGQLLCMYLPDTQMLETYDLQTLKKVHSQKNPRPGPISYIGMGLLNPTRLFVLHVTKSSAGTTFWSPSFLRLADFAAVDLRPDIKEGNNPLWGMSVLPDTLAEGGMDEYGRIAVVRRVGSSPAGLARYVTTEEGRVDFRFENDTPTTIPEVSHGGGFVLARDRVVPVETTTNVYGRITEGVAPYRLARIAGYPAFAEYCIKNDFTGFRVFGLPAMNTLMTTRLDPAMVRRMTHNNSADQLEIMLASAYCDRIAYILPKDKRLLLFPLGLKSGEPGSGFAQPGKNFTRKLTIANGSRVVVQSGPPGLRFDQATNALIWPVPTDFKTGQTVQVILLISNADGKEEYVVERISVP